MWFARAFTDGVRAEAPPPDRPRTRLGPPPRAAPVATPAQARLSPRARIERGARRHVRLRACCMVSGWPAPRMHHAPCAGPSPLARSLLVSARRLLRAQLSSARWSMAWWGRARMQTPICSRAVPRFLLLCPRPRRAAAQQGAAQAAMAWHVRQAACSAQWCVPVRCMPGCLSEQSE